ncbi:GatB/YqeY domain-containing protein [Aliihoeflea sp. PC F10.4]
MRDKIAEALKQALKSHEKRRVSTLRLIQAAITDRDIANRGVGKEPVNDEEILQILSKMVKQREESAKAFEEGARLELAAQEREEIEIVREFLPVQMSEDEIRKAAQDAIAEVGAEGLRDMGKAMAVLKERYPGKMDFAKASATIKALLA